MEPTLILKPHKGFTLIEMLVVLAIIAILTSIMVLNQSTFNKSILLTDTAYRVALSARQAQSFGLSSRRFGSVSNAGYGLHFDSGITGKYTVFVDTSNALAQPFGGCPTGTPGTPDEKPGNCRYDSGSDGVLENYTFSRGYTIKRFCVKWNGNLSCSDGSQSTALTSLDVVFMRPNTATIIAATWASGGTRSDAMGGAQITLVDPSGENTKNVCISTLGQVMVNTDDCI